MRTTNPRKTRARQLFRLLAQRYPEARCALDFGNPLQLLVATILSAQCTDVRVNLVTPTLFARYADAAAYAMAEPKELETLLRSINFFRNKAANLRACCRQLVEQHDGQVPATMEELIRLPGVGRKTANVILSNAFDTPGITVDTHVGRLSRRWGLTEEADPGKVEADLMELLPKKDWTMFSHRTIYHGRQVCHARKPRCDECTLAKVCPRVGV